MWSILTHRHPDWATPKAFWTRVGLALFLGAIIYISRFFYGQ